MNRRTAITAIPLALAGVASIAKGNVVTPTWNAGKDILSERQVAYALSLIVDASTSGIGCSFVAFAHYVSSHASAGNCEAIRAAAEQLLDGLYGEHNHYNESRQTWLAESLGDFAECFQMDDNTISEAAQEVAVQKAAYRHARREAN